MDKKTQQQQKQKCQCTNINNNEWCVFGIGQVSDICMENLYENKYKKATMYATSNLEILIGQNLKILPHEFQDFIIE